MSRGRRDGGVVPTRVDIGLGLGPPEGKHSTAAEAKRGEAKLVEAKRPTRPRHRGHAFSTRSPRAALGRRSRAAGFAQRSEAKEGKAVEVRAAEGKAAEAKAAGGDSEDGLGISLSGIIQLDDIPNQLDWCG